MGDISHVMPTLHPYMGGASGSGHGADYAITDPRLAYLEPAKQLAMMAVDMLADGAAGARQVLAAEKPRMTREELPRLPAEDRAGVYEARRRAAKGRCEPPQSRSRTM